MFEDPNQKSKQQVINEFEKYKSYLEHEEISLEYKPIIFPHFTEKNIKDKTSIFNTFQYFFIYENMIGTKIVNLPRKSFTLILTKIRTLCAVCMYLSDFQ